MTAIDVLSAPASAMIMSLLVLGPTEALKSRSPLRLTMGSPDWADDADEV